MSQLFHFQDVKPIACTYGGFPHRFSTRSDLKDHINKNHTCQKPHQCENCGQCFATRSERSSHKRIHINEKKYQCEFCSKSFARSSGLSNHVRVHTIFMQTAYQQTHFRRKLLMRRVVSVCDIMFSMHFPVSTTLAIRT